MRALLLMDPTGRALTVREKVLYWLIVVFFATLFLPPKMPVFNDGVIAAIIGLCLVFNSPVQKIRLLLSRKAIIFMLLFFLLELISAAISDNQRRAWFILGYRASMLIFPAMIGLIMIGRELKNRILLAYCVILPIAAVCCLIDAIHRTWIRHDAQWMYDDSLTILMGRTSVYMALMVVLAMISLLYLLEERFITGRLKYCVYGCLAFLLIFHYLLASKLSLLTLYTMIIIYIGGKLARHRRPDRGLHQGPGRWLVLAAGLSALAVAMIFLFPKTVNRFRQLQYTGYDYHSHAMESHYNMTVTPDQWNSANFRLAVWSCGLAVCRRHPITGVPLGDKQASLMAEYKVRDFQFAYTRHRNLHSTWLDVLLNTGIPGLAIFFLGYLIWPVSIVVRSRDWLGLSVIAAFAMAMLTETWIDNSFGTIQLAFWLSLVSAWQKSAEVPTPHPIPAKSE